MQTTVPGFERWQEDEQRYITTLERDRAQLALHSALVPQRPRRRDVLPLFDEQPQDLFMEES